MYWNLLYENFLLKVVVTFHSARSNYNFNQTKVKS